MNVIIFLSGVGCSICGFLIGYVITKLLRKREEHLDEVDVLSYKVGVLWKERTK